MSVFHKGRKITGGGITINQRKQADWEQKDPMEIDFIKNKPAVVQADWEQADEAKPDFIKNKPAVVQADWGQTDEAKPDFIKNKPAVVQADWEQTDEAKPDFIKNKPRMEKYFTKEEIMELLEGFVEKSDLCYVRWVDEDGTELARKEYYAGQAMPSYDGTPTKASTVSHTYTFSGWTEGVTEGNTTTYTAQYTATEKTLYTVVWKNGSTTLQTKTYYDGQSEPSYSGSTPTKSSYTSGNYTYSYTWKGWDNGSWSGNTKTYTAQFNETATLNQTQKTTRWVDYDGTVLHTETGTDFYSSSAYGITPLGYKKGGVEYTFDRWVRSDSGNTRTYTARYIAGCFTAGTPIWTPDGYKPIEDMRIGDPVLTYNFEKQQVEQDEVIIVWSTKNKLSMCYISVENELISATWNHKFYVNRNGVTDWLQAQELKDGDQFMNDKGEWHEVTDVKIEYKEELVFDIGCKKNHNFFVTESRVLVHNIPMEKADY